MRLLVLCAFLSVDAVVGVVLGAPLNSPQNSQDSGVQLLRYDSKNDGLGTYSFSYEQSDGSNRNEEGELRNAGAENEFVAVKGSYRWISPDGAIYEVNYIADENGYQPTIESGPTGALPLSLNFLINT